MSEPMIIVKDDGTSLVGSDGDKMYDGVRTQVGWEELVVTTEVAADGRSFTRTTALPNGEVRSRMSLDFAGFAEANETRIKNSLGQDWTDAAVDEALDAAWEAEKNLTSHSKVMVDAIVDGELTSVEKKITFIEWTER